MNLYRLNIPTRIYFGRNIWQEALEEQLFLLQGNIMVVTTGRSLVRLGYLDKLKSEIEKFASVKQVTVFDAVSANPKLSEVREGILLGRQENANLIIGFGGGSAIDAAKAVAVGIGAEEDIGEFFCHGKEPGKSTLPILAMPTTAGTGSELSKAAILTDAQREIKNGIRGEALYPAAAIVDSAFTESVPLKVTMETGFDVLAHAMESYISKAASPFTQMQSEYVIGLVGKYLPRLLACLEDTEAREKISFASMIMGINLGNAGTCLPHRLQYPLGAHTDTSHGSGLAALYPAWVEYEYPYTPEKIEKAAELLTGKSARGREECARVFCRFIKMLGLPCTIRELGIKEELLSVMAQEVSGNIKNDPAAQEEGIILKLYERAWQEEE